jgi:carotenoid cleavage dioxygenase-like enzyme
MPNRSLLTATRASLNLELTCVEGSIPTDWYGHVYINSGAGSVNSQGLPYPEKLADGSMNPEFGSPVINGDGYVIRLDCRAGKLELHSSLYKPPCYYADLETAKPTSPWHDLAFDNLGIARISIKLGTRNQCNTAFQPFRLPNDDSQRILATFDAGRPYEFDPASLKLTTPIGPNTFWQDGTPPFLHTPFNMVLTTAHPVFDPATRELFTVNFTKTTYTLLSATRLFDLLLIDRADVEDKLIHIIDRFSGENIEASTEAVNRFLQEWEKRLHPTAIGKVWEWVKSVYWELLGNKVSHPNTVNLIRWRGQQTPESWEVVTENGENIRINHNMHQVGYTQDYIILCDTNFKFTLDVMLNNPFPGNARLDAFFRRLLSGAMEDYSTLYIVKRSDLVSGARQVKAKRVVLPVETVHFSANYTNDGDKITLHTAHNTSSCPAEWLRFYDRQEVDGQPIDPQRVGLIAVGAMDLGKIGKIVVDVRKKNIDSTTDFLMLPGNPGQALGYPHTWAVGLYTYRDMCSATTNVEEITHIYWQCYGISKAMLSEYIYKLYKSANRNRTFTAEQVKTFTRLGVPFVLECVDTVAMQVIDFYTFQPDEFYWSLQFVPKAAPTPGVAYQRDGYIVCTVVVPVRTEHEAPHWQPQIWVFDATNLAQGPVCKLQHEDFSFAFTIHSVWTESAAGVPDAVPYHLPVRADYDPMISRIPDSTLRQRIQALFDGYVYPPFEQPRTV